MPTLDRDKKRRWKKKFCDKAQHYQNQDDEVVVLVFRWGDFLVVPRLRVGALVAVARLRVGALAAVARLRVGALAAVARLRVGDLAFIDDTGFFVAERFTVAFLVGAFLTGALCGRFMVAVPARARRLLDACASAREASAKS